MQQGRCWTAVAMQLSLRSCLLGWLQPPLALHTHTCTALTYRFLIFCYSLLNHLHRRTYFTRSRQGHCRCRYEVRRCRYCDELVMVCVCVHVCMWQRVCADCHWTHDEEPLPLPIFIHADDVGRRRRFISRESALSFKLIAKSNLSQLSSDYKNILNTDK